MHKLKSHEILDQRLEGQAGLALLLARHWHHRLIWVALVALVLGLCLWIIAQSGGGARVIVHLAYVPIVLAGVTLGLRGGVLTGLVAGLLISPITPFGHLVPEPWSGVLFRTGFFIFCGTVSGVLSQMIRAAAQQSLLRGAVDTPTGLPTVQVLQEVLSQRLADNQPVAVFAVMFHALRPTATAFGIEVADRIYQTAVARLMGNLPDDWSLYRGESILFILVPQSHPDPKTLLRLVHSPVLLKDELPLILEACVGLASGVDCGTDGMLLMRRAVLACDEANLQNLTFKEYSQQGLSSLKDRLRLLADLQTGLTSPDVVLFFQPKIHLRTGKIVGAEALIRWHHPRLGWLSPGTFVPMVEQSALMPALTMEVMVRAVAQAAKWHHMGQSLKISVNVSAKDFAIMPVAERVSELLQIYDLPAEYLEIELTESAASPNLDGLIIQADLLHKTGVSLAIDDYGTGQSGLSYLMTLRPKVLKIDQSFVRPMGQDMRAHAMVVSTINLAKSLGIKVVAEGVETLEMARSLAHMGCDEGQGYFFSSPLPALQLTQFIKAYEAFPQ